MMIDVGASDFFRARTAGVNGLPTFMGLLYKLVLEGEKVIQIGKPTRSIGQRIAPQDLRHCCVSLTAVGEARHR